VQLEQQDRVIKGVQVIYVIAVVQPQKLDAIRDALSKVGVLGITISDVQGYGRQKGHAETYRGAEYAVNFVRKVKLEIACGERDVDTIIQTITDAAKTGEAGKVGDGKIFVMDLKDVVRIRTGERGSVAI
jgi:nitrogen regulatory protein PII